MNKGEKLTAIRFMLAVPDGVGIHITALPDYVFTYIYEVGAMLDLPWLRWREDDTGQMIYRIRITQSPNEVGIMLRESPLFHNLGMDWELDMLQKEQIGLDAFEKRLLGFAQKYSFKIRSIF